MKKPQSMKLALVTTALIGGLGLGSLAHAEGLYIGGSAGGSHYKGDDVGALGTDRSSTGVKLFGGYQLTPNLGVEAGYVDFGKFDSAAGSLKADALYLDAVGRLPLVGPLSAIGRVGLVSGKTDGLGGAGRDTNAKLGAGLEYAIDRNLSVRGEWERYRLDTGTGKANTDMYSIGVKYAF